MSEFKFPTETVDLPSKGLVYPKEHILRSGKVEVKYMTAKEEDILTNSAYIKNGTVIDKLIDSVIVTEGVNQKDLIVGDKNAVMIATRILGYGADYKVMISGEEHTIDLGQIENKEFDVSLITEGQNEFSFKLPHSKVDLTYKILTGNDENSINREVQGLKKLDKNSSAELSTRMKYMILSVNGDSEKKTVREFVDNGFLARDARAFRDHIKTTSPDVDLSYVLDNGKEVEVSIGLNFFWPELGNSL
jgi:hypothetical protein|tara:strand:+ start:76 stop:816 length:741 start_codon:yes stop_codon:yes gene_type:complete